MVKLKVLAAVPFPRLGNNKLRWSSRLGDVGIIETLRDACSPPLPSRCGVQLLVLPNVQPDSRNVWLCWVLA